MGLISLQAMLAHRTTVGTAATFLCDFMRIDGAY
jgi:hypothetical protein